MRPCPRRLCHLDQTVQGPLLLAVLIVLLFTLPSFIKEPNTKPSRNKHQQNIKERSPELLQNAMSQAPTTRRKATTHMGSVQGTHTRDTPPKATVLMANQRRRAQTSKAHAKEPSRVPTPTGKAALQTRASKDTQVDTLPPTAGGGGVTSSRTEAPSLNSQNPRPTKGSGDWKARPTGPGAVPMEPRESPATAAKTLLPKLQAGAQAGKGARGATPAAAPSQDRAQPTRSSAPPWSPATQRSQKLKAANFKSEPQWDFEDEYSLEVGGLQTVSFPSSWGPEAHPLPSIPGSAPKLCSPQPGESGNQPREKGQLGGLSHTAHPALRKAAWAPSHRRGDPDVCTDNYNHAQYMRPVAYILPVTCPDSVKIKASKSPWLRTLFLPNLTLFLDSGHFNQSEWDRLEHFPPPFGFMELNFSLVQKVVARFPPVPQQQLLLASLRPESSRCISCAVVGNGGILNNSHVGLEIDSHDYVFRLSGAVIKGYEHDVGTRTSFYGFTAFSLTQSLLTLGSRGFRHVPLGQDVRYLHFLEGTRDYEWLEALLLNRTVTSRNLFWFRRRPQEAFQEALQLDRYLLLHPDLLRYMKNRFLRSETLNTAHWRIYRPTTGALLLLAALQLCDRVSAYGFITEGHERFSDHYYDKSWKRTIFYINHDFKLERTLWKRLHDEGIIRLYQRPMTSKPTI